MQYIIFDLEATCWKNPQPHFQQEIIEIGACALNRYGEMTSTFSQFVKPVLQPFLSPYCKDLTGISQENVNKAKGFGAVITQFLDWCEYPDNACLFLAWGSVDKELLHSNFKMHQISTDFTDHYIDLKLQYLHLKGINKTFSLDKAIEKENMEWVGKRHRALDDAHNLARIFWHYRDNWKY